MGSNRAISENPQTGPIIHDLFLSKQKRDLEQELENRVENLLILVNSVQETLEQESFSNKSHALDFVSDLRLKITASHKMLQVAKLLREPARESMLARVEDGLEELEQVFASRLGVKMS